MQTKTFSLSTLLGFLGLVLMIHFLHTNAKASAQEKTNVQAKPQKLVSHLKKSISCSTIFQEKKFIIHGSLITFLDHQADGHRQNGRSLSSLNPKKARTHVKNNGFSQTVYVKENKFFINIHDTYQFSEVEDFLSITDKEGHTITYPLECHFV